MQVTERIHAISIPFKIDIAPEMTMDRSVFVYLVFGAKIHLIDSGVSGSESIISGYIKKQGRDPEEISSLILTHSHPDHIGAARSIKNQTGCCVFAHRQEQDWIEDVGRQYKARPVPGFQSLVEGSVKVDNLLDGDELLELEKDVICEITHTPGHSRGSISLLCEAEKALFTGDALVFPGDLPIYEDISESLESIKALRQIENVENLFSSWEPPIQGHDNIRKRMDESIVYLQHIHAVVNRSNNGEPQNSMELCEKVVSELGLPPFAVNPLVAKAFASSLAIKANESE